MAHLPGFGIHALELRLAAADDRVDLSLGLTDRAEAARWRRLPAAAHGLLNAWIDGRPSFEAVSALWLEMDLIDDDGPPAPILCLKLDRTLAPTAVTDQLAPFLVGRRLGRRQRRRLHACLDAVPASGRLLYVFGLGARGTQAVRLELFGLPPDDMARYLATCASTDHAAVVDDLAPLVMGADRFHLSIDVTDEVAPRIGIEAGFVRWPHREPGWRRLLDRLVDAGLAAPAKRDALLGWPGYETRATLGPAWPDEAAPRGYLVRSLSHLKLVAGPGRRPTAKAYLLFQYLDRHPRHAEARHAPTVSPRGSAAVTDARAGSDDPYPETSASTRST